MPSSACRVRPTPSCPFPSTVALPILGRASSCPHARRDSSKRHARRRGCDGVRVHCLRALHRIAGHMDVVVDFGLVQGEKTSVRWGEDRKSTRLNSSHLVISYAVLCVQGATDALLPLSLHGRSSDLGPGFELPARPPRFLKASRAASWLRWCTCSLSPRSSPYRRPYGRSRRLRLGTGREDVRTLGRRSEEHTSELQSPGNLVCRPLRAGCDRRPPAPFPPRSLFRSWAGLRAARTPAAIPQSVTRGVVVAMVYVFTVSALFTVSQAIWT